MSSDNAGLLRWPAPTTGRCETQREGVVAVQSCPYWLATYSVRELTAIVYPLVHVLLDSDVDLGDT
jgi:hypothetical protein